MEWKCVFFCVTEGAALWARYEGRSEQMGGLLSMEALHSFGSGIFLIFFWKIKTICLWVIDAISLNII